MGKLIVVKKKDGKKLNIISEIVSCGLVPCRDLATLLLDDDCLVRKLKKTAKMMRSSFVQCLTGG